MKSNARVPDGSGNPLLIPMGKDCNEQPETRPSYSFGKRTLICSEPRIIEQSIVGCCSCGISILRKQKS